MIEGDKKVVVTGGVGFIGSHLSELLSNKGYDVTIIDDLSTGKITNIEPLLQKNAAKFVKGSITDLSLLQEVFHGAEYIFHQAAIPSVPRSIDNPAASHEANITGTLNVLLAARDNSVRKVIAASTSSVYGDTPTLPKQEDMIPSPQSPYAVTKLAAEYYCRVFSKVYGLPTVCLRYFNVYGPKQDPESEYAAVIPKFITRTFEGKPPIIYGDGEQSRDFTFVRDVAVANILAAENDVTGVFNIGTGKYISLNSLAKLIIRLIQSNVEPIHQEPRRGDIRHSLADISKAQTFGYEPKYSLEEGLIETIRSFNHER